MLFSPEETDSITQRENKLVSLWEKQDTRPFTKSEIDKIDPEQLSNELYVRADICMEHVLTPVREKIRDYQTNRASDIVVPEIENTDELDARLLAFFQARIDYLNYEKSRGQQVDSELQKYLTSCEVIIGKKSGDQDKETLGGRVGVILEEILSSGTNNASIAQKEYFEKIKENLIQRNLFKEKNYS